MKIALLHYHLKPGGVTTVIHQQVSAAKDDCEFLVITGSAPANDLGVKTIVIPEIGYDDPFIAPPAPETIAQKIITAISSHWPSGCDILHVHNPLLAKNRNFLKILAALCQHDVRLFLQIHDFAEDGRPRVYYEDEPYPSNCHFGVINSRDFKILLKSGLKQSGLHRLFNMVTPFKMQSGKQPARRMMLYPVRAIRRKNIGEALLLSLFFRDHETLAITLPPNSPRDWKYYNTWKRFSAENDLNILFEASTTYDFKELVASAKGMITTSISEGFGFSYLEPWTAGQMLTGRLLPDICRDFTEKNMRLNHLYDKLLIPAATVDISRFYEKWKSCIHHNAAQFKISFSETDISEAYERLTNGHHIDFAMLDESFQMQVISKIRSNKNFKSRIRDLNPFLSDITGPQDINDTIPHNRRIVETEFNQTAYRKKLLDTWQKVIDTTVTHQIDKQILAKEFLTPENFSLVKWGNDHV